MPPFQTSSVAPVDWDGSVPILSPLSVPLELSEKFYLPEFSQTSGPFVLQAGICFDTAFVGPSFTLENVLHCVIVLLHIKVRLH